MLQELNFFVTLRQCVNVEKYECEVTVSNRPNRNVIVIVESVWYRSYTIGDNLIVWTCVNAQIDKNWVFFVWKPNCEWMKLIDISEHENTLGSSAFKTSIPPITATPHNGHALDSLKRTIQWRNVKEI